jgi:hypothetical protein
MTAGQDGAVDQALAPKEGKGAAIFAALKERWIPMRRRFVRLWRKSGLTQRRGTWRFVDRSQVLMSQEMLVKLIAAFLVR